MTIHRGMWQATKNHLLYVHRKNGRSVTKTGHPLLEGHRPLRLWAGRGLEALRSLESLAGASEGTTPPYPLGGIFSEVDC